MKKLIIISTEGKNLIHSARATEHLLEQINKEQKNV